MRVVGTLTTMPYQYDNLYNTLCSINKQSYKLDAIYLNLPTKSKRLNIDYPRLPDKIKELCTVVPCEDYGPITKLYGGLYMETDPDTVIISFDDDFIYPEKLVETLVKYHKKYPNSAIGSSGMLLKNTCPLCAINPNENYPLHNIIKFTIPPEGRPVDSIFGYPGALYIRKFFPSKTEFEANFFSYALINDATFLNDDIIISGYLSLFKIERRLFPDIPPIIQTNYNSIGLRTNQNVNEISAGLTKFMPRLNRCIEKCKEIGMFSNPEYLDTSETLLGMTIIFFLSVLLLIGISIYLIYY